MMDIEELAKPLAGEKPAGENMEYDQAYLELETIVSGQGAGEDEGPDWRLLAKNCKVLWEKTRDLRVAVYLVIAEAITDGLEGLAAGLKLPVFLVRELWDSFYPVLDPDDDDDPLERLNILSTLSPQAGAVNDPVMFIPRFRKVRLVPSLGYTLRDLLISLNEIEVSGDKAVDPKLLRAELMNVPVAEIETQASLVREALALTAELCEEMNGKMKGSYSLDTTALDHELNRLAVFYQSHLDSLASASPGDADGEAEGSAGSASPSSSAPEGKIALLSYQASTRAEALLLLKKGAEYFQNYEPNSPIPHLIERALRFAGMSFIELLEDIAPDALSRGRDILGIKPE
jgi:type VI secretion system ImpA family protein